MCLISVGIEEDPNGQYAPKNRIKRVKKFDETKAAPKANGKDADPNDEIPF